uniref:hypothetical protein n=1 Tax=Roseivirga sp. TaxID=1964215 RepID=UPI0040483390
VFGFSQVNSEHCRHKIFNGVFIIDGNGSPGESQTYVDFSLVNWIDASHSLEVFNDLFRTTNNKDGSGGVLRPGYYGMAPYVLGKVKNYISKISEVQVIFGAHYGRLANLGLTFSPILQFNANVEPSHLYEAIKMFNSHRTHEGATVINEETGEIVYFNYLRPCPPFGNCQ